MIDISYQYWYSQFFMTFNDEIEKNFMSDDLLKYLFIIISY